MSDWPSITREAECAPVRAVDARIQAYRNVAEYALTKMAEHGDEDAVGLLRGLLGGPVATDEMVERIAETFAKEPIGRSLHWCREMILAALDGER